MVTLLLTLIAHTLADFLFQTHNVVTAKDRLQFSGFLTHGSLVFIILAGLLSGYHWLGVLLYSLIITAAHLTIDVLKALLIRNRSCRVELTGFIADQILHFLVILLVWQVFDLQPDSRITGIFSALITPKLVAVFGQSVSQTGWSMTKVLGCVLAYLTVCWGGAVFIQKFLRIFPYHNDDGYNSSLKETGRYIGILERALILTLVMNNSLTAVVFIFTAKSIARYNELNNRDFAEYYLVGTLLSTALAFGCGLIFGYLGKLI
ncbi:MAG TPA: DUF3307 domain-containing protein [Bacillota bacterium]|nr:DUF3307 domain-containing protein [Bacillota bacterium]